MSIFRDNYPNNIEAPQKLYIEYSHDITFDYSTGRYPDGTESEWHWETSYIPIAHKINGLDVGRHEWMRIRIGEVNFWSYPIRMSANITNIQTIESEINESTGEFDFSIKLIFEDGSSKQSEPITIKNGLDGVEIVSAQINEDGYLIITYSNGVVENAGMSRGQDAEGLPAALNDDYILSQSGGILVWVSPEQVLANVITGVSPIEYDFLTGEISHNNNDGNRHIPVGGSNGYILSTDGSGNYTWLDPTELDPTVPTWVKSITETDISNWNTAYGWGDHSLIGYLTIETDPVFIASEASNITTTDITNLGNLSGTNTGDQVGDGVTITGAGTLADPFVATSSSGFMAISGINSDIEYLNFQTDIANPAHQEGRLFYDQTAKALSYYNEASDVTANLGRELLVRVYNDTGSTILNGKVVAPNETYSGVPTIVLADARQKDYSRLVGVTTMNIPDGSFGYVTKFGSVSDIDTTGFTIGQLLYLSDTVPGDITTTRPTDGSYAVVVGAVAEVGILGKIIVDVVVSSCTVEINDTNGFTPAQRVNTSLSVVDGTRTFTISASSYPFHYYVLGEKFEKTSAQSIVFPDVEGHHSFYFDENGLQVVTNPSEPQMESIILNDAYIGEIYWNAVDNKHELDIFDERHGISLSPATHNYLHLTRGAQYVNGFGLGNFTISSGNADIDAQFSVSTGKYLDEDIAHELLADIAVGTTIPIIYNSGAGLLRATTQAGFAVRTLDGTSATRLCYNLNTGGVWSLAEVPSGDYVLCHIYAINGTSTRIVAIMGQNYYTNTTNAREGANNEIANIQTTLPLEEFVPIGTIIFQTNLTYTNSVNARVILTADGENYVDWRVTDLAQGVNPTSHANLTDVEQANTGVVQGHISDQVQSIYGVKTFNEFPVTPSSAPTTDYQVANKKYVDDNAGGSMVYPGAGIALSTGSAWGTSITNNSANWNTAYGWGNHAGLYALLLGDNVFTGYQDFNAPTVTLVADETNNLILNRIDGINWYNIPAGITDSGYRYGEQIGVLCSDPDFLGTLNTQVGLKVNYGSYPGSGATGVINTSIGLYLYGYDTGDAQITNKWGIYQVSTNFMNYLAGNTGIGLTSAQITEKLNVAGNIRNYTTNPKIICESSDTVIGANDIVSEFQVKTNDSGAGGTGTFGSLQFIANGNWDNAAERNGELDFIIKLTDTASSVQDYKEVFRVTHDGKVGIGTATPAELLDVTGNALVTGVLSVRTAIDLADNDIVRFGTSDDWELFHNGTNNYMDLNVGDLIIRDNTTTRVTIARTSGTITAADFILSSDARLKSNINYDFNQTLDELRPASYIINGQYQIGFIAQDLLETHPELVLGTGEKDKDGYIDYYSIKSNSIVPIVVKEVKSLKTQLKQQSEEINELRELVYKLINK